jgi:hypothetical protein
MPAERELAFPEFCCPLLALGGVNVTKGSVPLVPGEANVMKGVVPLIPRGAGTLVDPITLPRVDPEGGSVKNGAGADARALLMEE